MRTVTYHMHNTKDCQRLQRANRESSLWRNTFVILQTFFVPRPENFLTMETVFQQKLTSWPNLPSVSKRFYCFHVFHQFDFLVICNQVSRVQSRVLTSNSAFKLLTETAGLSWNSRTNVRTKQQLVLSAEGRKSKEEQIRFKYVFCYRVWRHGTFCSCDHG